MRVLIIEQEKTLQNSLSLFLRNQKNCQVFLAGSRKQGLSLWKLTPCDAAICGDRLPDGSGLEILKCLVDKDPKIVSIFMTARHDEQLRREVLQAGIKVYLEKPFDLHQLEEAMGFISP